MKGILISISLLLLSATTPLAAEDFEGYLIDVMCSAKVLQAGPDVAQYHTKECALSANCKASGYGLVTADGRFLKFDEESNGMAVKFLETSAKDQGLKVTVNGEMNGDVLAVKAIQLL